jgi:hypothetical protein
LRNAMSVSSGRNRRTLTGGDAVLPRIFSFIAKVGRHVNLGRVQPLVADQSAMTAMSVPE